MTRKWQHLLGRPFAALLIAVALLVGAMLAVPGNASAADVGEPVAAELVLPMAPSGEGGDGIGSGTAPGWIVFAVGLAPAGVLMTGLLWLTFGIDRSEGRE